jgi:hypothetical protein
MELRTEPDSKAVCEAVSAMLGHRVDLAVDLGAWTVADVPYDSGSPATGGLHRVRGRTRQGRPWSIFVKVLQHPRHWPPLAYLPPHLQAFFLEGFPWRAELAAWEPAFAGRLPAGLRLPELYLIEDLGDDRLAVWMEDVATCDQPWDLDTFRRAARALGGLAARRSDPELIAACEVPPGHGLRRYVDTRVHGWSHSMHNDKPVWRHPALATAAGDRLRTDLSLLYSQTDTMLDHLDALPQAMPHGDASPQNLLVPASAPETFVAIDVAFCTPHAVGFDLGQLLVGLVHAGQMPAAALPATHEVLIPSYVDGYRSNGGHIDADSVMRGYILTLMLRSGFTSVPFESLPAEALDGPPTEDLHRMIRERASLTRYILDLTIPILSRGT